jgi:bacteriorhodopsin
MELTSNKDTISNKDRELFKESFAFCYLILFGTAAITFIEALRNSNVHARHILNLETAVSLTAGLVYGWFRNMTNSHDFNYKNLTNYRYIDWAITTPMLLLILLLFINFHSNSNLHFSIFALVVILDFAMLLFGYMGERELMNKRLAQTCGFIALALILYVIYNSSLKQLKFSKNKAPFILFIIFGIIWSMYGIAAEMDDRTKNLLYNVLDIISKVFFGIGLWGYYGGVFGS